MSSVRAFGGGALRTLAREQFRPGFLAEEQLWAGASAPSRLPRSLYVSVVAVGILLTAAQVGALPRFLTARHFGEVVLAISVTQGFFQFGDLGLGQLSDNILVPKLERDRLRTLSFTAATIVLLMAIVAGTVAYLFAGVALGAYFVVAAATAWVLYPTQLRAQACEARGDEIGGALRHVIWQNGPKAGLVAGAVLTRTAGGCLLGGLVAACLVSAPKACSLRFAREIHRLWRRWLPSLVAIVAPFVIAWSDTYFVAVHHGLEGAAGYALVYRILGAVGYLYLPFGSVLLSRWNRGEHDAAWRVPLISLSLCMPVLGFLGFAMAAWGRDLFPSVSFSTTIIPPLILMYVFANLSYLAGTTLSAVGQFHRIMVANLAGALVAVAGHLLFTLRASTTAAALVSLAAVATTAGVQGGFAASAWRARATNRPDTAPSPHPVVRSGR